MEQLLSVGAARAVLEGATRGITHRVAPADYSFITDHRETSQNCIIIDKQLLFSGVL